MASSAARKGGMAPPERCHHEEARPLVELPLTPFLVRAARAAREVVHEAPKPRPIRAFPATSSMEYTAQETEFLIAVDVYKREQRKPFLTNTEMYALLTQRLGYGKILHEA